MPRPAARSWITLPLLLCACNSLSEQENRRLEIFETYWEALDDRYPFFGRKGIDWGEVGEQYRASVLIAETPSDFYHLLTAMLTELRDPHVWLEIPRENWRGDGEPSTSLQDLEGFSTFSIDGRLHVGRWPRDAEPVIPDHLGDEADLPEIIRVGGAPAVWPLVQNMMRGRPASSVELILRWSDGTLSRHVLRRPTQPQRAPRASPASTIPSAPHTLEDAVELSHNGRFATLRVRTFDADDVDVEPAEFIEHVDELIDEAMDADGLVVDLRRNQGGSAEIARALTSRLLRRPVSLALSLSRESWLGGLFTATYWSGLDWTPRPPVFEKPVVVLTDRWTGSAAEHVTRVLQISGTATVIGERTIGAEAVIEHVDAVDGSRLIFGSRRILGSHGHGLQDEGAIPDIVVKLRVEDVRKRGSYEAALLNWRGRVEATARRALAEAADRERGGDGP